MQARPEPLPPARPPARVNSHTPPPDNRSLYNSRYRLSSEHGMPGRAGRRAGRAGRGTYTVGGGGGRAAAGQDRVWPAAPARAPENFWEKKKKHAEHSMHLSRPCFFFFCSRMNGGGGCGRVGQRAAVIMQAWPCGVCGARWCAAPWPENTLHAAGARPNSMSTFVAPSVKNEVRPRFWLLSGCQLFIPSCTAPLQQLQRENTPNT